MEIILFFTRFALFLTGYLFFELTSSDNTGGDNKFDLWISKKINRKIDSSLKFKIKKIKIHIHHWLYCLVFTISGIIFKCDSMYFFIGGTFHGIYKYDDWHKCIEFSH